MADWEDYIRADDSKRFEEFLERMRKRFEEDTISEFEAHWTPPSQYDFPMPNECHPFYERHKDTILHYGRERDYVQIPKPVKQVWAQSDVDLFAKEAFPVYILQRQYVQAPAPWVGDLSRRPKYVWFVMTDELGREVSSEAWLSVEPRFF